MSAPSNVDRYHAATEALTAEQRRTVDSVFIGYVSSIVPADQWDRALAFAVEFAAKHTPELVEVREMGAAS